MQKFAEMGSTLEAQAGPLEPEYVMTEITMEVTAVVLAAEWKPTMTLETSLDSSALLETAKPLTTVMNGAETEDGLTTPTPSTPGEIFSDSWNGLAMTATSDQETAVTTTAE